MKKADFDRAKEIQKQLGLIDIISSFYKLKEHPQLRGIGIAARDEGMKAPHTAFSLKLSEKYEKRLYKLLQDYKKELETEFEEL